MSLLRRIKFFLRSSSFINELRRRYVFFSVKNEALRLINNEKEWGASQQKFLYEILAYSKQHVNYYRGIIPNSLSEDNCKRIMQEIPLLDKEIIREQGKNIFSDELIKEPNVVWLNTGGSTGEPLRFPRFHDKKYLEGISQMILYERMGGISFKDIIIAIDGTRIDSQDIEKHVYWKRNSSNFPYGLYSFSTLYMSPDVLSYYVDFMNIIKPTFLRGYPSGILELAQHIVENMGCLKHKPKAVYLTSEGFDNNVSNIISTAFNCPVYGQYGHTESSVFAIKGPNTSSYECLPFYGYTEVLNEFGKQVEEGSVGEIVVTGFSHKGLPFIRYKTGDLAEYGGTRNNGIVVLNKLMGRTVDYIVNKDGERVFLTGFIFGGHLKAFNYIKRWQLEQKEKGFVSMKIIKGAGFDKLIEKELIDLFASKKINVAIIYCDEMNSFERTKSGKTKFLIQHIC